MVKKTESLPPPWAGEPASLVSYKVYQVESKHPQSPPTISPHNPRGSQILRGKKLLQKNIENCVETKIKKLGINPVPARMKTCETRKSKQIQTKKVWCVKHRRARDPHVFRGRRQPAIKSEAMKQDEKTRKENPRANKVTQPKREEEDNFPKNPFTSFVDDLLEEENTKLKANWGKKPK